ncbi:MAG: CofH family radical SAM protein [Opitutales bacterium]|nr:CofH family radical SAM protein [Opitutales bacterium]
MENLLKKVGANQRISVEEALGLEGASLFELARLAQARCAAMGLGNRVSYIVNRMINYSNACFAKCKFCAYHARAGVVEKFVLSDDEILKIAKDAERNGAVQIMLQGGLSQDASLDWACSILRKIKAQCPKMFLHVFSPSEVFVFARNAGISLEECVRRLKEAGADSVPGAADMLVEKIRKDVSPLKTSVEEWKSAIYALKKNGMFSSATMTFGLGETFADRIEHMRVVREIQDETNVFKAFIAWPLAPENTRLSHIPRVSAVEFLKTIALARIFLDNIGVVQSGWLTEGMKVAELAIMTGCNDMGGVLMDEMVVKSAGIGNSTTAGGMRAAILAAGKIPFERDGLYEELKA